MDQQQSDWDTPELRAQLRQQLDEITANMKRVNIEPAHFAAEVKARAEKLGLTMDTIFGLGLVMCPDFAQPFVEGIFQVQLGKCHFTRQVWEHPARTDRHSIRVDVLAVSENFYLLVVEMENRPDHATVQRALAYLCALYHSAQANRMKDQKAQANPSEPLVNHAVKLGVAFIVNGDAFGTSKTIEEFRFVNSSTGAEPDDVMFRAVFINRNGDLSEIKNDFVRGVLENLSGNEQTEIGRMVKQVIAKVFSTEVGEQMAYIHALDPAIWEELAMARDQAAAAAEDARAARAAQVAAAEDARAARAAQVAAAEDVRAVREAAAEEIRIAREQARIREEQAQLKDELFDYFFEHQLDMSVLREVNKDPERVAQLHREVFG